MHAMIYYGFVILFLGTVTLELDHIARWPQASRGPGLSGYSAILDAAGLVFLGGGLGLAGCVAM